MSSDDITKIIVLGIPALMLISTIVWHIRCYIFKDINDTAKKVDTKIHSLSEAIKECSVTTEEATEEFKKFKIVVDEPTLTINEKREALGLDKIKDISARPLTSTLYADNTPILTVSQDETIERISPPKEYCQCDHCGTFYNEFVSNCKNCGAQIKMPSELYERDYIIKANYTHRLFDI